MTYIFLEMNSLNDVPYVPYIPYTPYVPIPYTPYVLQNTTCLRALNYNVPTCLRALIFHVPTCLHAYIYIFHAYLALCLKLFRTQMRSFLTCIRAYHHSQNILRLTSIPCNAVFSDLFGLSFHSKPQNKLLLLKMHTPILSCRVLLSRPLHTQKQ